MGQVGASAVWIRTAGVVLRPDTREARAVGDCVGRKKAAFRNPVTACATSVQALMPATGHWTSARNMGRRDPPISMFEAMGAEFRQIPVVFDRDRSSDLFSRMLKGRCAEAC